MISDVRHWFVDTARFVVGTILARNKLRVDYLRQIQARIFPHYKKFLTPHSPDMSRNTVASTTSQNGSTAQMILWD
jgi:hypothetical protein